MKIIFILCLLFNVQVTLQERNESSSENKGLIANGQMYDTAKYPFVVGLTIMVVRNSVIKKTGTCTGTLISKWFVLTAAHCTNNITKDDINVHRYNDSQSKNVQRIYQHKMYNSKTYLSDISLLKLEKPFKNVERYITVSGNPDEFANGKSLNCVIIGFGQTADVPRLNLRGSMTNSTVTYGPTACKSPNRSSVISTWNEYLCSKPDVRMVCPGDSGGPMICNGFLYGIASHGYDYTNEGDFVCGSDHMQTRHLFVYNYRKWISDIASVGAVGLGNPLIPLCKLYITSILLILCVHI